MLCSFAPQLPVPENFVLGNILKDVPDQVGFQMPGGAERLISFSLCVTSTQRRSLEMRWL